KLSSPIPRKRSSRKATERNPSESVLLSRKDLVFRAIFLRGVVARASCLCVSTKLEFFETHRRDARATILVVACRVRFIHVNLRLTNGCQNLLRCRARIFRRVNRTANHQPVRARIHRLARRERALLVISL